MKTVHWTLAMATAVFISSTVSAQDTPKKSEPAKKISSDAKKPEAQDSPLVAASKKSATKRDKQKIVITNETVKKSTGKLTVGPARPPIAIPLADRSETRIARYDAAVKQWKAQIAYNQQKIDALTKEIAELEGATGRFEEDFYNEDDPAYRDFLESKYDSASERLKAAKEELDQARTEQTTLEQNKPRVD